MDKRIWFSVTESRASGPLPTHLKRQEFQYRRDSSVSENHEPSRSLLIAAIDASCGLHMTCPIGAMLGRYRVDGLLGQGRTGIVYRAFDTTIERTVAIKCLRREGSEAGTDGRALRIKTLFEEAKVIGQLNHEHITAIYDMGETSEGPYLVMEFVEGETLRATLSREKAPCAARILKFIVMVARALHYVHQRRILHGDIKPSNILVTRQGLPKVTDFGVALRSSPGQPAKWSLAQQETVWGTPGYVAPEQLTADELDSRADIFALGVITYEWLAGRRPFSGATPAETLRAVVEEQPVPLSEVGPFDTELSTIVRRAIARSPTARFESADAFADALEVYLDKACDSYGNSLAVPSDNLEQLRRYFQPARSSRYFADFSEMDLARILGLSRHEKYRSGEVIIEEGSGGSAMYLLLEGSVSIRKRTDGDNVELRQCRVGDCFGEMAVISQMPRSASIVALEPTEVIAISGAVLRQASPALSLKLYRNIAALLSERVRDSDQRVAYSLKAARAVE